MTESRRGEWIQTFLGHKFWPMDPRPEDIHLEDIAHALSMLCRFGGHCLKFYSVAEHSIRCYRHSRSLKVLLHDASEAYLVDVPRPIKMDLPEYREAEGRIQRCLEIRFGLTWGDLDCEEVKKVDAVLIATEVRDLMAVGPAWKKRADPLEERITNTFPQETAREEFLLAAQLEGCR